VGRADRVFGQPGLHDGLAYPGGEHVHLAGRADFIAVIGITFGQILAAVGEREDARLVLQRSAEMFLKLGREDSARKAIDLIRQLGLE
jgi:hypothetical protein